MKWCTIGGRVRIKFIQVEVQIRIAVVIMEAVLFVRLVVSVRRGHASLHRVRMVRGIREWTMIEDDGVGRGTRGYLFSASLWSCARRPFRFVNTSLV